MGSNRNKTKQKVLLAPAKVNLFLAITGIDSNQGYHLLDMLNFPLDLKDRISIRPIDEEKDQIIFSGQEEIPENNTITKTLEALRKKGLKNHYQILVEKEIPSQAGLGGGSSDAAALLNYLNELEGLHLSDDELIQTALEIGADVLYLLDPVPARIAGKGEQRKKELEKGSIKALLIFPGFGISTPEAFRLYDRFAKEKTRMDHLEQERKIRLAMEAWNAKDYDSFYGYLENELEPAAFSLEPRLFEIKSRLQAMAHQLDPHSNVIMSGSGSSLLVLAKEEAVEKLFQDLEEAFPVVKKVVIG